MNPKQVVAPRRRPMPRRRFCCGRRESCMFAAALGEPRLFVLPAALGRHCEERSDAAIQSRALDCFATLALTREINAAEAPPRAFFLPPRRACWRGLFPIP